MSTRKTRRQSAMATAKATPNGKGQDDSMLDDTVQGMENGSAHVSRAHVSQADNKKDKGHGQENIFLFIPNIIGYLRIVLAVASLYYMPLHPRTCSLLYSISCLLDALDGYAARYFQQSTRFGAVLDMITDRCTTTCLLVFLSSAFPRWIMVFQGLIALDLASHYTHVYATLAMGGSNESHKNVTKTRSWILNLYYTNKNVLFLLCMLNESFFIALYLLSFSSPLLSPGLLQQIPPNAAVHKGGEVNSKLLSQIFTNTYSAAALELARANKIDSTVPWIVAGLSTPGMLVKQFINVVQFVKASRWLAEGDVMARRAQGLPRSAADKDD